MSGVSEGVKQQLMELLTQLSMHVQAARLDEARVLMEQLYQDYGHIPNVLEVVGKSAAALAMWDRATVFFDSLVKLEPNNVQAWQDYTESSINQKAYPQALKALSHLRSLGEDSVYTRYQTALVLSNMQQENLALKLLSSLVEEVEEALYVKVVGLMGLIFERLNYKVMMRACHQTYGQLTGQTIDLSRFSGRFFLTEQAARDAAEKHEMVELSRSASMPRICYAYGQPQPDDPPNLILLSKEITENVDFYQNGRVAQPDHVWFDYSDRGQLLQALNIGHFITSGYVARKQILTALCQYAKEQVPAYDANQPLRIFMRTSIYTEVMQYSSKNLAKALQDLGHVVQLYHEQDAYDVHSICYPPYVPIYQEFNPHASIYINQLQSSHMHDDSVNIIWWQDRMPIFDNNEQVEWRENDINLSPYPQMDGLLEKLQAPNIQRQDFCFDESAFYCEKPLETRKKAIFIGSSYARSVVDEPEYTPMIEACVERFKAGLPLDHDFCMSYKERDNLDLLAALNKIPNYVVRDMSVAWFCQHAQAAGYEVEVYGRDWDMHPEVAPFFKGELPHGEALAEVYNEARYALSALNGAIRSQRLAELSACGAIPIVYDAGSVAERPEQEQGCLFYQTEAQMAQLFGQVPTVEPTKVADSARYSEMAKRVERMIRQRYENR
ncbi:glycosyltransferase family protein [Magnetococcus sp. PR-3]|uniref:glycosyltransferase family protein n=1 Tax=Magnetococcus sp. PR-3 TaxID=3120355 RepID=UPI002FCE65A1